MPFVHSQFRLKSGLLNSEKPALFASNTKKERNDMFEICNDKTYFLAETTTKNKTIEITLARDRLRAYTQHREVDATAFVRAMYDEMQIRDKGFS